MMAMLDYGFPDLSVEQQQQKVLSCQSIADFQTQIMYKVVKKAVEKSIDKLTFDGFENLRHDESYLFISNHRDIILDTSLLNVALHDCGLRMTASAIGDNLVQKKFLKALSMLNRNFIIHRGLGPRESLEKSKIVSDYIKYCIAEDNRSVWIAQREGRTKNGDDKTQQGVLKMLTLSSPEGMNPLQYFKTLRIVPIAISYEFDPTDMMKIPALMAQHYGEEYVKSKKEDFQNIIQGLVGQKGRVHISLSKPLDKELDRIETKNDHINKQMTALTTLIDDKIHRQYKLFPANYIAFDLLYHSKTYEKYYNEKELRQFERRLQNRGETKDEISRIKYLEMYANPVKNKYA